MGAGCSWSMGGSGSSTRHLHLRQGKWKWRPRCDAQMPSSVQWGLASWQGNFTMWVPQCHVYQPWLGVEKIPPLKMLMTGGDDVCTLLPWKNNGFPIVWSTFHPFDPYLLPSGSPGRAESRKMRSLPGASVHSGAFQSHGGIQKWWVYDGKSMKIFSINGW